ncbi:alpha/beta hydrolase [Helicobacter macacae]|uniref:Esterase n=1 Tax=Helicobacter macacae MIT 99-5501 TaxID=1357400 RepID=V8C647_9HELI|nr:alpha/beta hydrolase-fold protein [Helicobacter macacae]ETD22527.1 hypothetical protein HMPREF2086_01843 [Helicobacter macacae MIT 99-5501]
MKYLFLVLCFGFSSHLLAKPSDKITALTPKAKRVFDTSQIGQIYANGAIYTIRLSKIKAQKTVPKSYKIFYILDGNGHLPIALNALSKAGFLYEGLESVLIVSIGYGGKYESVAFPALRKRDYTPKYKLDCDDSGDFGGSSFVGTDFSDDDSLGGGAEQFLQTLQNDIIPFTRSFVQERLGVEIEHKSGIFGHSFGGLFVLYALSNSSGNFSHFYAVSPSLWWGGGEFIGKAIDFANIKGNCATLWIMQDKISQVSEASKESEAKIRTAKINSKELVRLIESQSNITTIYKAFYGHTHGSVVVPAFLHAISDFAKSGF